MILGVDNWGTIAWHVAATWGKLEILQKLCNSAREELTTEEVYNKLFLGTDNEGMTVFSHYSNCGIWLNIY